MASLGRRPSTKQIILFLCVLPPSAQRFRFCLSAESCVLFVYAILAAQVYKFKVCDMQMTVLRKFKMQCSNLPIGVMRVRQAVILNQGIVSTF